MADERMKLSDLLKNGADDVTVIRAILKSSDDNTKKKQCLVKLRTGVQVSDDVTRQIELSQDAMLNLIKELNIDIDNKFFDVLCKYYEGKNEELRQKISKLYDKTLSYTVSDGGFNNSNNIDVFRQRINKAVKQNLDSSRSKDRNSEIFDEISYAVVNSVLSADKIEEVLREECPQDADEILRQFRSNYTNSSTNIVNDDKHVLAEASIANGYADQNAANNTTSDIVDTSNLDHVSKSDNAINNSFEMSKYSGGNTSTNAISITGSGAIADRRSALLYQLSGIMSYWDILEFISDTYENMHDEKAKNQAQTKHDSSMQQEIHEAMHEITGENASIVRNEHRDGVNPIDEKKEAERTGAHSIEDDSNEIGSTKETAENILPKKYADAIAKYIGVAQFGYSVADTIEETIAGKKNPNSTGVTFSEMDAIEDISRGTVPSFVRQLMSASYDTAENDTFADDFNQACQAVNILTSKGYDLQEILQLTKQVLQSSYTTIVSKSASSAQSAYNHNEQLKRSINDKVKDKEAAMERIFNPNNNNGTN